MAEQNNKKLPKSWYRLDNQRRLSLEDFLIFIRENLTIITIAREKLQSTYSLLQEQEKTQQDQYNYLVGLAYSMDSPVEDLSRFLDQRTCLPVVVLPLRHQLTTKLLIIKELLWMVLVLVGSLRSSRQMDPRESAMTHYKMLQKLDILLQESENIIQFTQVISDQAHFQENKDTKTLDRMSLPRDEDYSKGDDWNVYDISHYRKR